MTRTTATTERFYREYWTRTVTWNTFRMLNKTGEHDQADAYDVLHKQELDEYRTIAAYARGMTKLRKQLDELERTERQAGELQNAERRRILEEMNIHAADALNAIGLRAPIDALPLKEKEQVQEKRSLIPMREP